MKSGFGVIFFMLLLALASFAQPVTVEDFTTPANIRGASAATYWSTIVEACTFPYQLDPYRVAGLVLKESEFIPTAVNLGEQAACNAGHQGFPCPVPGSGLTQITGPWVAGTPFPRANEYQFNMPAEAIQSEAPRVDDLFNPRENLSRGCWYLKSLVQHYSGNTTNALLAYRNGFFGVDAGAGLGEATYANTVNSYRAQYMAGAGDGMSEEDLAALLQRLADDGFSNDPDPDDLPVDNPDDPPVDNPDDPPVDGNTPVDPNTPGPSVRDTDGDGIPDSEDEEPLTPIDTDMDGVPDHLDPDPEIAAVVTTPLAQGIVPLNSYTPPVPEPEPRRVFLSAVLGLSFTILGFQETTVRSSLSGGFFNASNPTFFGAPFFVDVNTPGEVTLHNLTDFDAEEAETLDLEDVNVVFNIAITDFAFEPEDANIELGTEVIWTNESSIEHWITSLDVNIVLCDTEDQNTIFDSCGVLEENAEWSFTFNELGTFDYSDDLNAAITGRITVLEAE